MRINLKCTRTEKRLLFMNMKQFAVPLAFWQVQTKGLG